MRLFLAALVVVLGGTTAGDTPGVSSDEILIGGTGPLSGPESAYGPVMRGAQAYFDYVNARGGVFGRKIVYKVVDDAYDPSKTVLATRQLVEQDHVLALFNQVGTEHALAVRPYLNEKKVPQLFVGSGADVIARQHVTFPWTIAYLPSFTGEGALYGRRIARTTKRAKVAVLYEDSDYGRELLAGLRKGLGRRVRDVVSAESYEVTDVDVAAQLARLKSSGADTLAVFAVPKQAIQALVTAARLGWRPRVYVTSVSIDPAVMQIVRLSGGGALAEGAISSGALIDGSDPSLAKNRGYRLYRTVLRRYLPDANPGALAHEYGMAVAYTLVDVLRRAGRNPTRASVLRAATHLRETNPFYYPGIRLTTSPRDYYPVDQTRLVRYHDGRWRRIGGVVRLTG